MHDLPEHVFSDIVILVTESISERADFFPRLIRHENGSQIAELRGGFRDPLQTPFHGVVGFAIFCKTRRVHARRIILNRFGVLDNVLQAAG